MAPKSLPTVLVVDDEPHSVAAMRMALEDEFTVLEAEDAAAAWALMEDNWVQVVISDQRMPGKTGIELLSEVRDRWPETVRIIVTGYTETNDMIQAINAAGTAAVFGGLRLFFLCHVQGIVCARYASICSSLKIPRCTAVTSPDSLIK